MTHVNEVLTLGALGAGLYLAIELICRRIDAHRARKVAKKDARQAQIRKLFLAGTDWDLEDGLD